jgi:hypothetical protein
MVGFFIFTDSPLSLLLCKEWVKKEQFVDAEKPFK